MKPILALLLLFLAPPVFAAEAAKLRLAVVNTPCQSGLMTYLLEDFETRTGIQVVPYCGEDVFGQARSGEADVVIAHYGRDEFESLVTEGLGSWPQTVFANQAVIIGPGEDPAGVRGLTDASQALRQIAEAGQPFVANAITGVDYLTDILWHKAGRPDKSGWYQKPGLSKGKAVKAADKARGYLIWGAIPFLQFKSRHQTDLDILVSADPLLQRVMAISLINPEKLSGINVTAAEKLRDYLLLAETQAKVAAFRVKGFSGQLWWPAARHN